MTLETRTEWIAIALGIFCLFLSSCATYRSGAPYPAAFEITDCKTMKEAYARSQALDRRDHDLRTRCMDQGDGDACKDIGHNTALAATLNVTREDLARVCGASRLGL